MARRSLREKAGQGRRGKELTANQRGQIEGASEFGATQQQIATVLGHELSTVKTTLRKAPKRSNGKSQPRTGRPQATDARTRRRILFIIKRNPHATYAKIRKEIGLNLSNSTLYRILQNIQHWIEKKRPLLEEDHAKARLKWCKATKNWTFKDWFRVIFTDECSLERGSGKRAKWV